MFFFFLPPVSQLKIKLLLLKQTQKRLFIHDDVTLRVCPSVRLSVASKWKIKPQYNQVSSLTCFKVFCFSGLNKNLKIKYQTYGEGNNTNLACKENWAEKKNG